MRGKDWYSAWVGHQAGQFDSGLPRYGNSPGERVLHERIGDRRGPEVRTLRSVLLRVLVGLGRGAAKDGDKE